MGVWLHPAAGVAPSWSLIYLKLALLACDGALVAAAARTRTYTCACTQVTDLVLHFLRDHKHDTNRSTICICMHMVATLTLVFYLPVDHDPVL